MSTVTDVEAAPSAAGSWPAATSQRRDVGFRAVPLAFLLAGGNPAGAGQEAPGADAEAQSLVEAELARAREQARRIVEEAERAAEHVAAAARAEVERRCDEAVAAVQAEQRQAFAQAAADLLANMQESFHSLCEDLSGQVAALAMEVAQKVVRGRLDTRPDTVIQMAREALRSLSEGGCGGTCGTVRLVVSAGDAEELSEHRAALLTALPPGGELSVVADETLTPGDVIAQGEGGEIDARIVTQLESIRQGLEEAGNASVMDLAMLSR